MDYNFRIFDFNIYNEKKSNDASYDEDGNIIENDEEVKTYKDNAQFMIQMFGVDETGKTCSIMVEEFRPFFYVMVNDTWTKKLKDEFLSHIKQKMGKYYEDSITDCIIIKRKKLYGFDGGKEHKFVKIEFSNINAFNKAKNIWYTDYNKGHTLITDKEGKIGYVFNKTYTVLYEANIPPLLRFFHIQDISPSGWIALPKKKTILISQSLEKKTHCDFEFVINYKDIIPLNNKELRVPYKICSFDIEASSSHGDFPVPIKSYKKLTTNIIEYFENLETELTPEICKNMLRNIILTAFGYEQPDIDIKQAIDKVYPKKQPSKAEVVKLCEKWLTTEVRSMAKQSEFSDITTIESLFEKMEEDNEDEFNEFKKYVKSYTDKKATIADIICDKKFERDGKINEINISLNATFPRLEGDKCTFIGSTFMNYGESEPYFNHCIVLNTCTKMPIENSVVESYNTEKEVLLAWQQLIQRENPDIIIGYNIFGFDYEFMFRRAEENNCVQDFLKLSRNKDEICANYDKETNKYKIEESSIQIASGQHDLKFIKINGRLQVDLYNFFRREENLTSYKLDYVAGHFIGDYVKSFEHISNGENGTNGETLIKTTNMTGLLEGSFIHIEEIGHSVDYYEEGAKFKVTYVNKTEGKFIIDRIISPDTTKKVRWCLAKDDVTPKDIFRMTNGTADDRSVIAKYCIQDCNLVHYLFNKADILTGFVEMAKICSVPINFLVMRGQGIKLTSYIAKKCREKRTLMPVIEKGSMDDGYEGAIVLEPKCDLYLDNPVACVDYASLYPSSMISENLSHDSKVWTKEYDLAGNLIEEYGDKDPKTGEFIYDNLPGFEYVNVTYDTYRYIRKTPSSAAEKVKSGTKICRFAQPGESGEGKAIMPAILEELLMARKTTRKLIPLETDEFMKNVLDKRQIGYKLTANSLYGQCGAKTSTFYEKDIAACTTATGRLLLTYAKKIIEECYGDSICNTEKYGKVKTSAEYIYGDTDSVFFTFNLQTLEGEPIRGKQALEITIELAQEAGHLASSFLKGPHDLEYEKTFMPFCLLSKKRYVGMLYETDPNKCKRKEMGIVLKRRDNAPIVKDIYGGIIDILMKQQNIKQASDFLKSCLQNIVDEKYPMDKLIITKSLRSGYKNPKSIAHKVLADRITARDPGSKPSSGDRIPFVYINTPNKKALQGDKIETPSYITENNLKIDYSFYITNQIMKPVQQVFALVLEKMWTMQNKTPKIIKFKRDVEALRKTVEHDKFDDKLEQLKNKEVKALLFDEYLRETNNEKAGNQSITKFFK
jgi:DNA polymerase elongation subunit (family B)